MKYKIVYIIMFLTLILVGCSSNNEPIKTTQYKINKTEESYWSVEEGLLIIGENFQELKFNKIKSLRQNKLEVDYLAFSFHILPKDYSNFNANSKEYLIYSRTEKSNVPIIIDKEFYLNSGSIKGDLINSKIEPNLHIIFLMVEYSSSEGYNYEIIALPTTKVEEL